MSSSLTRKSSWERPSSLYSASSAETSYTKPSYSSSSTGGDSGYSSKYSSTSSDYKPSWRSSLNSSDSNSSLTKYGSRPVSTVSESGQVSDRVSRFEASTPTPRSSWRDAESAAASRLEAGTPTPRSSWRDSFKEDVSTTSTPKYGSLNRDAGDSYLSRYSSREPDDGPAISRFSSLRESRKGREEGRLSREEIKEDAYTPSYRREEKKEEPSYTSRYSSLREEKKEDPVTSRFSSLNKEEKKEEPYSPRYSREEKKEDTYTPSYRREEKKDEGYGSRYSSLRDEKKIENGETNGHSSTSRNTTTLHIEEQPTTSRFGSAREDKKEETNGTTSSRLEEVSPKYKGYESILAKYGTAQQAPPTSQALTSPSHTSPATTVASPQTTDTINSAPASYNNSAQYNISTTSTTSTSDSASSSRPTTSSLPVPGTLPGAVPSPYSRTNSNTSTSSLAVPGNAYSRSNSNNSTSGVDPPFGSSPYTRQLSKENNGVGGVGHLADESSLSRSLERRASSKKLPFGPSGPAPPTFSAFEKTIEKSNSIQEKIEATLNKHNVGPKQVI